MESVIINVDGSCRRTNDETICAIGVYWGPNSGRNKSCRVDCLTSNQAELVAAFVAIQQALELNISKVIIQTDSQYVQLAFSKWIHKWKTNNWRTYSRKPVKNQKLIRMIDEMLSMIEVKFVWQRGHISTNVLNKSAHDLAFSALMDPNSPCIKLSADLLNDKD